MIIEPRRFIAGESRLSALTIKWPPATFGVEEGQIVYISLHRRFMPPRPRKLNAAHIHTQTRARARTHTRTYGTIRMKWLTYFRCIISRLCSRSRLAFYECPISFPHQRRDIVVLRETMELFHYVILRVNNYIKPSYFHIEFSTPSKTSSRLFLSKIKTIGIVKRIYIFTLCIYASVLHVKFISK